MASKKTVIVTGASQGIGAAVFQAFLDHGYNNRVPFIKPDVAVVDALLTVRNVNSPDGTIIPLIPINFFYVAVRHTDKWLIQDGRADFAAPPPSSMTKSAAPQD